MKNEKLSHLLIVQSLKIKNLNANGLGIINF